ncbi:MAG: hypothetical protein IKK91_05410, partial [Ruminococcus sp.]|nr:hypothetical protein [Ruminococcus sp.]
IIFPKGTYKVNNALLFYSNQTLWFEIGAVILQGASIDNLLRTYSESTWGEYDGVHDCLIYGATFDGGTYTTNNTLVGISHAKNIIFERCVFKNAYGNWHNLEINSSYNVKVINCEFEGSRKTGQNGEMLQIDGAGSSSYYPWSNVKIDNTVSEYIDIHGCIFHDSTVVPAIGNHSNMAHKFVRVHDCIFDGLTSSRGALNFVSNMSDIDIYDNTFNGCDIGIGSSGATYYVHDNRFVNVTTAISGTASISHNNMINGSFVA